MIQNMLCILLAMNILVINEMKFVNCYDTTKNLKWRSEVPECNDVPESEKVDCHPDNSFSMQSCLDRGCCFKMYYSNDINQSHNSVGVPRCYFPSNYISYLIEDITKQDAGFTATLKGRIPFLRYFPQSIANLAVDIVGLDETTIRVKITDKDKERFEVPIFRAIYPSGGERLYRIELFENRTLHIIRKSSNVSVFTIDFSWLIYCDQLIQVTVKTPTSTIYGLGEHYGHLKKDMNWQKFTMFNKDEFPKPSTNLYGSHPFYLALEKDNSSHGVALFNSNAMDVILQPAPAVTFRTIGGILHFFVYVGPSPSNVVSQHTRVAGIPFLPPYWSLGFHLSRSGLKSINETRKFLLRNINAGIPLDALWNDIDYMKNNNDFTYDPNTFKNLSEFVDGLHSNGYHYVLLLDPGVSGSEPSGTYPPYDDGIKYDLFVKDTDDKIFIGKARNLNSTVFPDFSHPHTWMYYNDLVEEFHRNISFDGIWLDTNEVANFLNETEDGCPKNSSLENPPYLPGDGSPLSTKTLCMSAKHCTSSHYNEHNLYALRQGATTYRCMESVVGRPFIISRASFLGQGMYTGHWSGHIASTWEDMRYSIVNMLEFNMFGVPMTGSDICGFRLNTTEELCARWSALGAFYPFARNHNDKNSMDQDPAAMGRRVIKATKTNLYVRYTLLPYLYTLFYRATFLGEPVARPVFFEFTNDKGTYDIEEQFMWGPALMIVPVLYPNAIDVQAYLPKGTWYQFSGTYINSAGDYFAFPASHDKTQLFIRSGYILPMQHPSKTTLKSRSNQFMLFAALNEDGMANGELFWDDGLSWGSLRNYQNIHLGFHVLGNAFTCFILRNNYKGVIRLDTVKICSINNRPTNVTINNEIVPFKYEEHGCLTIHAEGRSLLDFFRAIWT